MKKFFLFLLMAATFNACNNAPIEGEADAGKNDSAARQTASLPYSVPNQPDWEKGSDANVAIAMNALKAYEMNDMNALQQLLTDSVEFHADDFAFEGSRDSLVQIMKKHREMYSGIGVNMHDYESVKSKKRGEEWVGLWYTETQTLKNGKVDSFFVMDDIQIANGKVKEIDSKVRRLPANK